MNEKPLTFLEANAALHREVLKLGAALVRGLPLARLMMGEQGRVDTAARLDARAAEVEEYRKQLRREAQG